MTPADLYLRIRQRIDRENSAAPGDFELGQLAEESYFDLWDFLLSALGEEGPWERATVSTVAGLDNVTLTLASEVYRVLRLEFKGDGQCWVPMQRLNLSSDPIDDSARGWSSASGVRYYARRSVRSSFADRAAAATNSYSFWKLYFSPVPAAVYSLRIYYMIPPPITMTTGPDAYASFPDDYPEYVVADVCAKLSAKYEQDPGPFVMERERIKARIERTSAPHQTGMPLSIPDHRALQNGLVGAEAEYWRRR